MKEQPECEVSSDGSKWWYLHNMLHREDGPAVEYTSGTKSWWLNDKLHREDGPAVEFAAGDKEWWFNGEEIHPEQIVDYHLMRGTFCYYDEQSNELKFNA